MFGEIIGFRFWDIKATKEGEHDVCGYSVWFSIKEPDEEFHGCSALKRFFPAEDYPDFVPVLGDGYILVFDQKGKFRACTKVSE